MGVAEPVEEDYRNYECGYSCEMEEPPYYYAYGDNPEVHAVFRIAYLYVVVDSLEREEIALEYDCRGFELLSIYVGHLTDYTAYVLKSLLGIQKGIYTFAYISNYIRD